MRCAISVTRLGDFLKVLLTTFLFQKAKINDDFLGRSEKHHSSVKTIQTPFWTTLGKLGPLFNSTSGHTVHNYKW